MSENDKIKYSQNIQNKYLKYKNKYINLKLKQKGGIPFPDEKFPIQDVYENCIEPIWKNVIANHLNDLIDSMYDKMTSNDIKHINNFLDSFNSLYEFEPIFEQLNNCLKNIGRESSIYTDLESIVSNCRQIINELFKTISSLDTSNHYITKTPYTTYDIGRVATRNIYILDKPVNIFSQTKNYFYAVDRLLSPYHDILTHSEITNNYFGGFKLLDNEKQIISNNVLNNISVNISMMEILLMLEKNDHNDHNANLIHLEIRKNDNSETIYLKMKEIISKSYFIIGKLFAVIANQLHYNRYRDFYEDKGESYDPIKTFLIVSGVIKNDDIGNKIANGFQRIALSHIAHGMSSAELVARIASSVRTSYPVALISALCVRGGVLHGGAMQVAIPMVKKYFIETGKIMSMHQIKSLDDIDKSIELNAFIEEYVKSLLANGKIFGFGHRIHKNPQGNDSCADPRALEYLEVINDIYGITYPNELKLVNKFTQTVRKIKPSLGCNSDFAIAVFCVLLDVPENDAEGMFVMCRIPGFCGRIVRELLGKGNARRMPFPVILPYIKPK